jgi:uncharacterized secreted protein with C-terminal beta-propeller domain
MGEELNRWLRRARPDVPADDGWAESPDGQRALAELHLRTARAAATGSRRRRIWLPTGGLAAAAAATAVVLLALSGSTPAGSPAGPSPGKHTTTPQANGPAELPAARPAAMLLSGYDSCSDLLAGLRAHTAAVTTRYGLPGTWVDDAGFKAFGPVMAPVAHGAATTAGAATTDESTGATSTTNDQEIGVDEPDVMKTDGDRVLTVTDGVLRVTDAQNEKVTGSLDLSIYDGWQNAQLLVDGDHALVLLGSSSGGYYATGLMGPIEPGGTDRTTALFVDLSGQPRVTGSLRADGGYLAARLIDGTVRLVVASAPTINFPQNHPSKARNRAIVSSAPLSAWQPGYTLTAGGDSSRHLVPCGSISHPAQYTGTSLLTVYTLDIADPDGGAGPVSVAADGDTVYATATSLYVASNPDWWTSGKKAQHTQLHRFDITGTGEPTYLGSASVPGRLLSQYSLDDYDGYLRVATTTAGRHSSSGVYDLDDATLTRVGHVGGLGKGEQIYAVRFAGPLAYVVTFRQTDPLYVVDLSDPAHPAVTGSLRLTGYSSYLHDAGDGRLIGVGEQIGGDNEPNGVQVSLFDVSDPSAPQRTGHVVRKGTDGAEQLDPHAFLYWQPTGLVVVPVESWSSDESGAALVLRVDGTTLSTVGLVHNPLGTSAPDDGAGITRSMLVDGRLWTLSSSGLQVLDPASLQRDAWIAFS